MLPMVKFKRKYRYRASNDNIKRRYSV